MAEAKVGVIIEAEDRASAVLAGVNSRMETMQSKMKSLQPTFQKMALIGTAAFAGISAGIYKSIEASQEAAVVQAQLGAVLKSTAGAAGVSADMAIKLSKSLQTQTTFGDEAILSAENLLLTFTKISKDIFPEATKTVLDMSVALGQDTKSSAIQLGKALQDPIMGITALRRVGVNFSDKQKDVIQALVESGKTMEAQKLILQELATEFGGSASAKAETFAGKMMQIKERMNDVQETIGTAFLPIIEKLVARLEPILTKFAKWVEENPKLVVTITQVGLAVAGFVAVVGILGMVLPSIIAGFTFLVTPIGLIVLALSAVIAVAIIFKDKWVEIFAAIDEKTGLITLMKDAWNAISETFTTYLLPALQQLWTALEPLTPFLKALAQVVGTMLVIAIGAITLAIKGWAQIFTFLLTAATEIATFFTKVFVGAVNFVIGVVEKAITAVEKLISAISRLNVMKGAKSFIGNVVGGAKSVLGIDDGIVQNGQVISTHPEDTIVAMKDFSKFGGGGKSININISGAILSQEAARVMGDLIINELRLNMKY